jgi:hypothetical protein
MSVIVDYVSPGDPNLTPNQIRELQDALNEWAEAAGRTVVVLPPNSMVSRGDRPERGLRHWWQRQRLGRMIRKLTAQVQAGTKSVNQARAELGLEPWDLGSR